MSHCPKCGQPIPGKPYLDAEQLLNLLRHGTPHREVYRAQDGGWYLTYGGERTTREAVEYHRS